MTFKIALVFFSILSLHSIAQQNNTLRGSFKKAITLANAPYDKVDSDSSFAINYKFPSLVIYTVNLSKTKLHIKARYTVINFWSCKCLPCLEQNIAYKKKYDKASSSDLNIISISTDDKGNINRCKNLIATNGWNWSHYIDLNKKTQKSITVTAYPPVI